jgi:hypothetical protein
MNVVPVLRWIVSAGMAEISFTLVFERHTMVRKMERKGIA